MNQIRHGALIWLATLGPVGFLPKAPGTWASAVTAAIWWFATPRMSAAGYALVLLTVTLVGVWVSTAAEKRLGRDAHPIVIDEFAGQWLALAGCAPKVWMMVAAFLFFRAFDIWKPFPINISQRLPGGVGVVVDDLIAGIYAAALIWMIRMVVGG